LVTTQHKRQPGFLQQKR